MENYKKLTAGLLYIYIIYYVINMKAINSNSNQTQLIHPC